MEISQDFFHNKRSYEAFMWAVEKCKQLQTLQAQGALIFDEDGLVTGKFIIRVDAEESCVAIREGNCTFVLVGSTWSADSGKILSTLKDVKNTFSKFKYVDSKHIKKVC